MLGLRPIPLRMLPDCLEVLDGCEAVAHIGHVRLELDRGLDSDAYGARGEISGTVYVDAIRSDGAFEVPVGAHVCVRGLDLLVVGCKALEAMNGNVHHWELSVRGEAPQEVDEW